ncbi:MAG: 23S rRNA (adenine(2030)-N(6))-methyltransferase RlmJ [bacterium]
MNYRHGFHAGNFADVLKHAILVRILVHLCAKPTPFRVIDTHAGAGRYDLGGAEASRSGEWRDGIARFLAHATSQAAGALLAPYRATIATLNRGNELAVYPGSPLIARAFLRQRDRLIACELEPGAAAALARTLRGDARCKAIAIDGWTALSAYIPPKERRGLVLIDPSFEDVQDFARLPDALEAAHRKWASGIYLVWYPLKERAGADRLAQRLRRSRMARMLRVEISLPAMANAERLHACGMIIINPSWNLEGELKVILPELVAALGDRPGGAHRLDWLARES